MNNLLETGKLVIDWYWPNQEQGIIHTPTEVILDTTAPNTPQNESEVPPQYAQVSPPPLQLEALDTSTRNIAPSETLEETLIKETSQMSSLIQREIEKTI